MDYDQLLADANAELARLRADNERLRAVSGESAEYYRRLYVQGLDDWNRLRADLAAERAAHVATKEALAHMTARAETLANALQTRPGIEELAAAREEIRLAQAQRACVLCPDQDDNDEAMGYCAKHGTEKRDQYDALEEALRQAEADNERLRVLLSRWLAWEGRSDDDPAPIEIDTAKALGHDVDVCELIEYGVCTCALAAPPAPAAPKGRWIVHTGLPPVLMPIEDEEDAVDPSGKAYICEGEDIVAVFADAETARRVVAAMNAAPAAAPAPPVVPPVCRGCGEPILPGNQRIADGCPCNSPRGSNHGLVPKDTCTCVECDPVQTGSTRYPPVSPPAVPEKCGQCKGRGDYDTGMETWDDVPIRATCPSCNGTGRAPAGGGR